MRRPRVAHLLSICDHEVTPLLHLNNGCSIVSSYMPTVLFEPKNQGNFAETPDRIGTRCAAARGTKVEFDGIAGLCLAL